MDATAREALLRQATNLTADELRSIMRTLELTQARLAQDLGVEPNTVWRWVNGKLLVPQYAVAYLCGQLQIVDLRRRLATRGGGAVTGDRPSRA